MFSKFSLVHSVDFVYFRYEMWARLSGEREVEALRTHTIAGIVKYMKDNPKAKKVDLQKEIARQITVFANNVEKL